MSDDTKDLFITVFTDASFCPHTKATGWAVWIKYGRDGTIVKHKGGYISKPKKGSTHAEQFALNMSIDMCKLLKEHNRMVLKDKIVILQSDCKPALNNVSLKPLERLGVKHIKLKWVKAHTGGSDKRSSVNNWCDITAYSEMQKMRKTVKW